MPCIAELIRKKISFCFFSPENTFIGDKWCEPAISCLLLPSSPSAPSLLLKYFLFVYGYSTIEKTPTIFNNHSVSIMLNAFESFYIIFLYIRPRHKICFIITSICIKLVNLTAYEYPYIIKLYINSAFLRGQQLK